MTNKEIALKYFKLSNESNIEEIRKIFKENSTYSSKNTGLYFGVKDIIDMQKVFHGSFNELEWKINSIKEIKTGIILIDFTFEGIKNNGETIVNSGLEYIIIYEGFIQHIEIK